MFERIKNTLRAIKHFVDRGLISILYTFSKLIPRDPHLWVFIGWHRHPTRGELFADNTKYFFLHVANNHKEICPIWLAKSETVAQKLRDAGYESYSEKSLKGIWCALRANKTIIDAFIQPVNVRWSGGSTIVQLMHGRGMKKTAYSEPQPCAQDIITVTSPFTQSLLPASFIKGSRVFVTGYPRNDVLFKKIPGAEIDSDAPLNTRLLELKKTGAKIISYTPTFRRGGSYADIESQLNIPKLSAWLEENNYYLAMSLHPKYRNQERSQFSDRIIFMDDCDIYPTLPIFDLFINDYSSLFVDELLLDKPMVFFPFDLDEYSEHEGIAFDYHEMMPGPVIQNFENLIRELEESFTSDPAKEKRGKVKKLYHQFNDGNSSERIFNTLKTSK